MKPYILFDLDGTLTDPMVGICTCVQYALASFGIDEPDIRKLTPFIGPPLRDSFRNFYGFSDEQAEEAVAKYRERYAVTGLFENKVYKGIPRMLRELKARGMHLAVASSKPQIYVERILEKFHLARYFDVVVGASLDGKLEIKKDIVAEALHRLFDGKTVDYDRVYMVGDRYFDVEGAHAFGIECVSVLYGYGDFEEMIAHKSDYIVCTVDELRRFLLRGTDPEEERKFGLWHLGYLLCAGLAFFAARFAGLLLGGAIASAFHLPLSDTISVYANGLGYLLAIFVLLPYAVKAIETNYHTTRLEHMFPNTILQIVTGGVLCVGLTFGLNMLFMLLGALRVESYQASADELYAGPFAAGLLIFGLLSPVAEELLFRGVIQNCFRRKFRPGIAIMVSALIFGVYHGNVVQVLYATLMGLVIACFYEYYGNFAAPLLFHIGANVVAYLLTYVNLSGGMFAWITMIVAFVLSAVCVILLRVWHKMYV